MPWLSDYEYYKLRRQHDFDCPYCHSEWTETVRQPDFRYSSSAYYLVECKKCGKSFHVDDRSTG